MQDMITSLTNYLGYQFSTGALISVVLATLGITSALALAWFAYRFIVRKVAKAMKKGSL